MYFEHSYQRTAVSLLVAWHTLLV